MSDHTMVECDYWKRFTLEHAAQVVAEMRRQRAVCDGCEREEYGLGKSIFVPPPNPFDAYTVELTDSAVAEGWEFVGRASGSYVKRCDACRVPGSKYPWAKHLDAERVRDWFRAQTSTGPIHVDALKELVQSSKS